MIQCYQKCLMQVTFHIAKKALAKCIIFVICSTPIIKVLSYQYQHQKKTNKRYLILIIFSDETLMVIHIALSFPLIRVGNHLSPYATPCQTPVSAYYGMQMHMRF